MRTDDITLDIRDLQASYGVVPALRGVTLQVARGEVITLVGANGAGKSTLMKCVSGLLKPTAGSVVLFGEQVAGLEPNDMVSRGLALVPEGRRLFGDMTVRENLELGSYARSKVPGNSEQMERCLTLFPDLKERLNATAQTLSGGQQQMLAVARALMTSPRVLLLDEPTIGLAPVVVDRIAQVIHQIRDAGVDVLLVEQNAEMALRISDYGYVIENGSVVIHGTAAELARNDDVRRAYMGL